ncbi:MAG: DUF72 domain-containing protein [Myxococcota bacterium]
MFASTTTVRAAEPTAEVRALGQRLPPGVSLGTSTWSFPGWAGLVWDRKLPKPTLVQDGLPIYAGHPLFRTVGIDRTFWAPVDEAQYASWAAQVSEVEPGFTFLVKAPERLTWRRFPNQAKYGVERNADNPHFLDAGWARECLVHPLVQGLGPHAGPVVFQIPPQRGLGCIAEPLRAFLRTLPPGPRYAVEIRSKDQLTEAYGRVLVECGALHCLTVHPGLPDLRAQWRTARIAEQSALVVRWNLVPTMAYEQAKSAFEPFDRIVQPDDGRVDQLARALHWAADRERPAWLIANNKAEGSAPLTLVRVARRLEELS